MLPPKLPLKRPLALPLAVLLLAASTSPGLARNGYSLQLEPAFFTGTYHTGSTVNTYYVPLTGAYTKGNASIAITIPYLSISGGGVASGGAVIGTGAGTGTGTGTGGNTGITSNNRNGLGDILLKAKYHLQTRHGLIPAITPYITLILPTASRKNGLGTGKLGGEAGATLQWAAGPRLYPFLKGGYRLTGSPPNSHFKNVPVYEVGVTGVLVAHHYLTLMVAGHPAIQRGFAPNADLLAAYDTTLTHRYDLQLYVDKGLTGGSAAFGAGMGVTAHF